MASPTTAPHGRSTEVATEAERKPAAEMLASAASSESTLTDAQRTTLSLLREYGALSDQLATSLRMDADDIPNIVQRIVSLDQRLYRSAEHLLAELNRRKRVEKIMERAAAKHTALLHRAANMQHAVTALDDAIRRARDSLRRTDHVKQLGRKVSVVQVLKLAQQVSYSNAAPSGEHALNAAAREGFRRGWGTPAPQQHMLTASRFAEVTRRVLEVGDEADELPSSSEVAPLGGESVGWQPGDPLPVVQSGWRPGDPLGTQPSGEAHEPQPKRQKVLFEFGDDDDDDD
eukprot:6143412-Pleurochrysis_carterae.AAC.1